MFGLGKKRYPLDDLNLSGDGNLGNSLSNNSQQQDPFGAEPSSMPNNDPLSASFLDDSAAPQQAQNTGFDSDPLGSTPSSQAYHPSEFNSVAPDSVVPTSPVPVNDPLTQATTAVASPAVSSVTSDASQINPHQLELISSKLDVLKAMMENQSQRISSLESKIDLEKDRQRKTW